MSGHALGSAAAIPYPAQGAATSGTRARAPLSPVLIVLVSVLLLVPEEASLFIGGLRMTIARLVLLLSFPFVLFRFIRHVSSRNYRFVLSDALIVPTGLWMVGAVWTTGGWQRALVGSGVTSLEFVGAYLASRSLLSSHGHALKLAHLLSMLIAFVGVLGVLDSLAGHYVLHDTIGAVSGYEPGYIYNVRHGALRAASTLEHPILLGTVCAFATLLGSTLRLTRRCLVWAGAGVGLAVALSSAPILATIIGAACLAYRRLTPSWDSRWRWLMACMALALCTLFLVHPAPFGFLISHVALDPATGYYRLLIWQIAGADVLNAPLFGVGLSADWPRPSWMPGTVDSVWLQSALYFGIPGSLLIAACLIGACSRRVDVASTSLTPDERRLGVSLSLIIGLYLFLGFTVHFWGICWVLMGLLAGMRAHLGALGAERKRFV